MGLYNTKIIVVDGLDCSGKEHITQNLNCLLNKMECFAGDYPITIDYSVDPPKHIPCRKTDIRVVSFPTYDHTYLINHILDKSYKESFTHAMNMWTNNSNIDPGMTKSAAFMADQFNALLEMNAVFLEDGIYNDIKEHILILDRYYTSNLWYNLCDDGNLDNAMNKLNQLLAIYPLPKPDYYFYIKMNFDTICKFLSEKENKDANELDLEKLQITKHYADLINKKYDLGDKSFTINANIDSDNIKSFDSIVEEIINSIF